MISILIVDDHILIREVIRTFLETTPDIQVVATAENGIEAITATREHRPDVVIMDISMPHMDGLEATRQILNDFPNTRVVMLSSHDNPVYLRNALEAGANGYVVKDAITNELLEAIRSLYHGRRYFSHQIADVVNQYINEDSESWAA